MIDLTELRGAVAQALEAADLTVFDYLPDQVHAPAVIIEAGDPYVTDDADDLPYGAVRITLTLHLIAAQGTAQARVGHLDELIGRVLDAIPETWDGLSVARPFALTNGAHSWPSTQLTITTDTPL